MAGATAGRAGHRWRNLAANQRAKRLPCWLCGQPIDYQAHRNHPDSFTVDHATPLSLSRAGAEDPANLRSAHKHCNSARGNRAPDPGLGAPSRQW